MAFTKLKQKNGLRVRVDLSKALFFVELEKGTTIHFANTEVTVEEGFQTVTNRLDAGGEEAGE